MTGFLMMENETGVSNEFQRVYAINKSSNIQSSLDECIYVCVACLCLLCVCGYLLQPHCGCTEQLYDFALKGLGILWLCVQFLFPLYMCISTSEQSVLFQKCTGVTQTAFQKYF